MVAEPTGEPEASTPKENLPMKGFVPPLADPENFLASARGAAPRRASVAPAAAATTAREGAGRIEERIGEG
jgi:hypothetical protein